jgi:hypothetical protein
MTSCLCGVPLTFLVVRRDVSAMDGNNQRGNRHQRQPLLDADSVGGAGRCDDVVKAPGPPPMTTQAPGKRIDACGKREQHAESDRTYPREGPQQFHSSVGVWIGQHQTQQAKHHSEVAIASGGLCDGLEFTIAVRGTLAASLASVAPGCGYWLRINLLKRRLRWPANG